MDTAIVAGISKFTVFVNVTADEFAVYVINLFRVCRPWEWQFTVVGLVIIDGSRDACQVLAAASIALTALEGWERNKYH